MNYQKKLEKLLTTAIRLSALRRVANATQQEIVEALHREFRVLENARDYFHEDIYSVSEELNLVLRGGVQVERNLKVPAFIHRCGGKIELNLNRRYGLKFPRTWSAFYLFRSYSDADAIEFKNGVFKAQRSSIIDWIDFGDLAEDPGMSKKHLNKFLEAGEKFVSLIPLHKKIDKHLSYYYRQPEEKPSISSLMYELRYLGAFSDPQRIATVIYNLPRIRRYCRKHQKMVKELKEKLNELLSDLREFNKPFKLMLKLQK